MGSGIHKVGVLGMGLMGSGIAQVAATRNFDTVVTDVSLEIVGKGMERIRDSLKLSVGSYRKSSGKTGIAPDEEEKIMARIKPSMDRQDLLACDIVMDTTGYSFRIPLRFPSRGLRAHMQRRRSSWACIS